MAIRKKNLIMDNNGKAIKQYGCKHFLAACCYSLDGLKAAWGEAAFRQEIVLGLITVPLAWLLPLGFWPAVLLNLIWLALLAIELLNSSLEAVVDLASPEYHQLAKRAKDMASAAAESHCCLPVSLDRKQYSA